MPEQIHCDHPIALGKVRELIAPVVEVAGPPMNQNQRYTAIISLERAIKLDPDSYELRYWLGQAYGGIGSANDQSIKAFEAAAKVDPNHIEVHTELGRQYLAKNALTEALDHLRLALQTDDYQTDDENAAIADFYLAKTLQAAGYERAALDEYATLIARMQSGINRSAAQSPPPTTLPARAVATLTPPASVKYECR